MRSSANRASWSGTKALTVGPPAKRAQKGGGRPTTLDGDRGTDWFQWEASSQVEAVRLMLDWLAGRLTELRPPEWRPGQA